MRITIVNVEKSSIPGKKYHQLEVAYKDDAGALKGKKIMSFGVKNGLDVLTKAVEGDSLDITVAEEKGYWNWVGVKKASGEAPAASPTKAGYSAPSRDFETSVERAKKQVLIVRQSSISAAINTIALTSPIEEVKVDDILTIAERFENWVMEDRDAPQGAEQHDDNIN
jgi:hypothetical protein